MGYPSQISFRRFLLLRLVLLSIPVVLLGLSTYRKARTGLLETARQNLTESAVRKGVSVQNLIDSMRANVLTASDATILQNGSPKELQAYLNKLTDRLPDNVRCLQLTNFPTDEIVASTCGQTISKTIPTGAWPSIIKPGKIKDDQRVYIQTVLPHPEAMFPLEKGASGRPASPLRLVMSAPVYLSPAANRPSQLRYVLSLESTLSQKGERVNKPGSLAGYTVLIDLQGTILEHPYASRVGRNISSEEDAQRLEGVLKNAVSGQKNFLHLFYFDNDRQELLAGYTSIPSPVSADKDGHWVVLAVTRLDSALAGQDEIKRVLIALVIGLLLANLLATLYIGRDLARPVEKLSQYALSVQLNSTSEAIPTQFSIREFNQLADALSTMVERLKAWAKELETAWQEAKLSNQLKREFLTTISHELRTPLNGIIGSIRLVRDDCCDSKEEELEFLHRADDAAMHLLAIIDDILDIAKIEAGQMSVTIAPVHVQPLLHEAIELQATAIQTKQLEIELPPDTPALWVQADEAKLRQVLLNVVDNAIKFTPAGKVHLRTYCEPIAQGDRRTQIVIQIQDTGIGIDPKDDDKLFQPFVMVDGSTTRQYGGVGLGLAISHNLMELMGGEIDLHSAGIKCGTTVEIRLPQARRN
jgi:signal transduction histidine kinase